MSSRRSNRSGHSSRSSQSGKSKSTKKSSSSTSKTSDTESSGRRSSAYDADFEQHLVDHGIYMNNRKSKPSNINEIRQRLAQPRPSLSPSRFSEGAFEEFQQKNEDVIDEGEVIRDVLPMLYGNSDIPSKQNLLFTRLESITNKTTVDAKPDFYDGARLESIDTQVREDLRPYIIPTAHRTAPVAPNFFIEAKAPKGGADMVKRQITHDLSLGARGMHKLQSYGAGDPVHDNNAYTMGAIYHAGSGTLLMYAAHPTPSSGPGDSTEYHMTQIDSWGLSGNPNTYRQGAAALRNGRDMAMEYRDQFISAANEKARSMNADQSTLESSNYHCVSDTTYAYPAEESQTSGEEFAATSLSNVIERSKDELIATSFSYPAATSFSYPDQQSDYHDLAGITEESETSTDEVAMPTHIAPAPSKKRPSKGSKKAAAKAPCYSTSTSRENHRSNK